jgi:hypothetical protein
VLSYIILLGGQELSHAVCDEARGRPIVQLGKPFKFRRKHTKVQSLPVTVSEFFDASVKEFELQTAPALMRNKDPLQRRTGVQLTRAQGPFLTSILQASTERRPNSRSGPVQTRILEIDLPSTGSLIAHPVVGMLGAI